MAVVLSILLAAPAAATSGAELLQLDESFVLGYIWGAVESAVLVPSSDPDSLRLASHQSECLAKAHINARTMKEAVVAHIRKDPSTLTITGAASVTAVIFEICGPPR